MRRIALLLAVAVLAAVAAGVAASPASATGCTPGFWKKNTDLYNPSATLSSVGFVIPASLGLGNPTFATALTYGGGPGATGKAQNLLRHAAAAYINTINGSYPPDIPTSLVISMTNAALASLDPAVMEDLQIRWWEHLNELGCPLDSSR